MGENQSGYVVWDIKRRIRRKYSAEEKITIVLEGLCGEESICSLIRCSPVIGRLAVSDLYPMQQHLDRLGVLRR